MLPGEVFPFKPVPRGREGSNGMQLDHDALPRARPGVSFFTTSAGGA